MSNRAGLLGALSWTVTHHKCIGVEDERRHNDDERVVIPGGPVSEVIDRLNVVLSCRIRFHESIDIDD